MIKLLFRLPKKVTVAVSGGVDSMALLDFLKRKHGVEAAFFHHATQTSEEAEKFLKQYCASTGINLIVGKISTDKPKELSAEEHWRNERYKFLSQFETVVTAHHLDDCVETWVWSSLHGTSSLIPFNRGNVLRPLLTTRKNELVNWCIKNKVAWVEDSSNNDKKFTRNFIRHELMPVALKVNPGLHKTLEKKIIEKLKNNSLQGTNKQL